MFPNTGNRNEMKNDIELPDMKFCMCCGLVKIQEAPNGLTRDGKPRKTKKGGHTRNEYSQIHRDKNIAAGLTSRGTVRKRGVKP